MTSVTSRMLLLGEHYHFPTKEITARYLRLHHLTLSADKKTVAAVAVVLHKATAQSKQDLINILEKHNAPVSKFLPALIDSVKSPLWTYTPSKADQNVLRRLGWK